MVAGDLSSVDIINNTVFLSEPPTNSDPAAIRIANISAVPKDIRIRNNIFITQSTTNRVRLVNSVRDSTYVFQRNNYFNAAGAVRITWGATTYLSASVADWLASTTQERLEGTIVALNEDPLLTNPGGGVTFDFSKGSTPTNCVRALRCLTRALISMRCLEPIRAVPIFTTALCLASSFLTLAPTKNRNSRLLERFSRIPGNPGTSSAFFGIGERTAFVSACL